jgi:hypothetical protein
MMQRWLATRRYIAALLVRGRPYRWGLGQASAHHPPPPPLPTAAQFVLFLMYMPIISASLRALDCTQPVDGVRYLRSELVVVCGSQEQRTASYIAYGMLVVVGGGFPALLVWLLGRVRQEQLDDAGFQGAWGFMYDGYRTSNDWSVFGDALVPTATTLADAKPRIVDGEDFAVANPLGAGAASPPQTPRAAAAPRATAHVRSADAWMTKMCPCCFPRHLLWWEALILLRKAFIVLLAVLVTNPFFQCAGASIVLGAALSLHLLKQPFVRPIFNALEGLTLIAAMMTAIISSTLLQYDVADPEYVSQPPAAMSAQEWAITIALAVVNIGTLAILAAAWLVFQYTSIKTTAVEVIKRRKSLFGMRMDSADSGPGDGAEAGSPTPTATPRVAAARQSKRRLFAPEPTLGTDGVFANPLMAASAAKHGAALDPAVTRALAPVNSIAAGRTLLPAGGGSGGGGSGSGSTEGSLPTSPADGFVVTNTVVSAREGRDARASFHGSAIRSPAPALGTQV